MQNRKRNRPFLIRQFSGHTIHFRIFHFRSCPCISRFILGPKYELIHRHIEYYIRMFVLRKMAQNSLLHSRRKGATEKSRLKLHEQSYNIYYFTPPSRIIGYFMPRRLFERHTACGDEVSRDARYRTSRAICHLSLMPRRHYDSSKHMTPGARFLSIID